MSTPNYFQIGNRIWRVYALKPVVTKIANAKLH